MNKKEIERIESEMLKSENWRDINSMERKTYEEMCLRSMIMSCLTYGSDIFTSINYNSVSKYYKQPYVYEYIDKLGIDRVIEVYSDQKKYFKTKCRVEENVYTDSEGLSYNSCIEIE